MGHHGGHGTTAAAMVHHVLSIYMSFVREMYVKYTFPPNKNFYCSRAIIIYPVSSGTIAWSEERARIGVDRVSECASKNFIASLFFCSLHVFFLTKAVV